MVLAYKPISKRYRRKVRMPCLSLPALTVQDHNRVYSVYPVPPEIIVAISTRIAFCDADTRYQIWYRWQSSKC